MRANATLSHIHDRMPVVIRPQDFARWLDCVNYEPRDVADLMQPVDDEFFEAVPVSDKVNKVANSGPDVQQRVEPATAEPSKPASDPPGQMKLF